MNKPKDGAALITEERHRQLAKGYTPEHDHAEHNARELIDAAGCYLMAADLSETSEVADRPPGTTARTVPQFWPWERASWKPSSPKDPVHDLVRAGALLAAAVDEVQGTSPLRIYARQLCFEHLGRSVVSIEDHEQKTEVRGSLWSIEIGHSRDGAMIQLRVGSDFIEHFLLWDSVVEIE